MTYRPHSGETSQMTKMGVQVKYEKQQKKIFEYYKQLLKFLKIKDDNLEEKSQVNSLLHEAIIIHELKEEPIIKNNGYSMVFEDVPQSENNHNQNDDNLTFNQTSNSSIFFESLKGQRKPSNIYYEMPNNDEDNNSEEKYSKKKKYEKEIDYEINNNVKIISNDTEDFSKYFDERDVELERQIQYDEKDNGLEGRIKLMLYDDLPEEIINDALSKKKIFFFRYL